MAYPHYIAQRDYHKTYKQFIKDETNKRFASPQNPSWKKFKKDHQDLDHKKRKSPSPEKPILQKNSGTSLIINSKDDLNKLAAKYLKADMMGDKSLAAKLKADLEEAKQAIKEGNREHQKMDGFEKCEFCMCMDQPNMKRHLVVTIQEQVYLSVPAFKSATKGHSLIVPKRHVTSFLHLDKDEWDEIEELKSLLRNVFRVQKKTVLFLETSFNFKWCPHAFLECIPVPEEDGDMAPFYFKKAIQESEEEWAHNIKLVDLSKKGLRKSIPKNLPYFCVLFDPAVHAGYAHVIENEKSFPRNFGKEVIGGMLDMDYNLYKNKKADALKKSNEALALLKTIKGYSEK